MRLPESPHLRLFLRRLILGLGLALLFAWLALRPRPDNDDRLVVREWLAMGTLVSVSLYLDEGQSRAAAESALTGLEGLLADYERRWRAWGDGELAALNARLAQERVSIPATMQPLFARAAELSSASAGRFDVRIGRLVELWGFHDETQFRSTPPDPVALNQAVAALAKAPPLPPDGHAYGPAPGVWLDFGAIAKGDAVDRAIDHLRSEGYANAIVNAGGNLRTCGRRGNRAWRIGIRHPRPDDRHRLLATLESTGDEAIITSGDYERYFEFDGHRYHHLLDPHSGQPAQGLQAVTVVTQNGALADAASTALFVAGPQHWREVARALGIDQAFVVTAEGDVEITAALAPRVTFIDGLHIKTVP
ncbi:thiamine biosynthesis lipoprotein [Fontimonas thermophila]|uniref:FAD:protein FMN transferase n=1 Tax=Fontimonas thermophila TaxID=1076937 RepID=A0A1I2JIX1_9GAMM|nr:FAD:protein FMN transferase [Fontimonas thermophila]SFF54815.1 thiamine biosynthesis lipoprotein [Fontimonas thermophila]